MRKLLPFLFVAGFMTLVQSAGTTIRGISLAAAQTPKKAKGEYDPPEAFVPSEEVLKQIAAKTAQLAAKSAELGN